MQDPSSSTSPEVRFAFGRNWTSFLAAVNEDRIAIAEESFREMLGCSSLEGLTVLDVGSGSGLFSLAARRLGASVHSFDYDPESVACAKTLRSRFRPDDQDWTIEQGSALDQNYLESLGTHDIVYAWGVLHHTGDMWRALDLTSARVTRGGRLFLALYNDQGLRSNAWRVVKRMYCASAIGRVGTWAVFGPYFAARAVASGLVSHRNPLWTFQNYRTRRGMSIVHDWRDWLGGYPFEVTTTDRVVERLSSKGFTPETIKPSKHLGCHQFIFRREFSSP